MGLATAETERYPNKKSPSQRYFVHKPDRPYPSYPLSAHATGQWKKRIGKADFYFGRWYDPDLDARSGPLETVDPTGRMWKAALAEYDAFKRRQAQGNVLASKSLDAALELIANAYLTHEHDRLDAGDLKPRTYENHRLALKDFVDTLGRHRPIRELEEEPSLATIKGYLQTLRARYAADTYNRHIRSLRQMFRWATNVVDGVLTGPLRLQSVLKLVAARVKRREQREQRAIEGRRMPEVPELRALFDAAPEKLRACYLLAFFGAYGQGDCAELTEPTIQFTPASHLGLPPGWAVVHYPRPKSGIDRACVLPAIAADALKAVLARRPKARNKSHADRVFLTEEGYVVCYDLEHRDVNNTLKKVTRVDNVKQWHALNRERLRTCESCGVVPAKKFARGAEKRAACTKCGRATKPLRRIRFYDLRHASITLTGGCDETARLLHEGHILPGVRPNYVEGVHVRHLQKIAETLLEHWNRNEITPLVGGAAAVSPASPDSTAA